MKALLFALTASCVLFLYPTTASATLISYVAVLSAAKEAPPTASPGFGRAIVTFDDVALTLHVTADFQGLVAGTTAAHIHCCTSTPGTGTAGVATITPTFTGFPSGVTFGSYDRVFDLLSASTYNPAFVTAQGGVSQAELALVNGLAAGTTYFNIHTTTNPGGEIRDFLVTTPEPGTMSLVGLGVLIAARKARRQARGRRT
jgi:hypothetical protein